MESARAEAGSHGSYGYGEQVPDVKPAHRKAYG
jgi:hypothetical protein